VVQSQALEKIPMTLKRSKMRLKMRRKTMMMIMVMKIWVKTEKMKRMMSPLRKRQILWMKTLTNFTIK
jgi:hypothetical protein